MITRVKGSKKSESRGNDETTGVIGQAMDIMKEVNALFFKKTLNLKKIRESNKISDCESSGEVCTDSSMEQFNDSQSVNS